MPYTAIDAATAQAAPNIVLGAPLFDTDATLAILTARLSRMLGGRTDLDPIEMQDWINDAYVDVATSLDLTETQFTLPISLLIDQPLYMLPAGVDYTTGASIDDPSLSFPRGGWALDKIDLHTYRTLPDDPLFRGLHGPNSYLIWTNILVVYPTPQKERTLTLEGYVVPQRLDKDTDSLILSREWHRAVLLKAKAMVLADTKSPQEAMLAENAYTAYVQSRSNRRALEKTNRLATATMPASKHRHFDYVDNNLDPSIFRNGLP